MSKRRIFLVLAVMMLLGGALFMTPALAAGPYQAENAVLGGGAAVNTNFSGYNGSGFVNFPATGGSVEFRNVDGGVGGSQTLQFRFALGVSSARTGRLTVNGVSQNITFNSTGAWTTWSIKEVPATLTNGTTNTIRLESTGQDLANVDQLEVKITATPTPTECPGNSHPSVSMTVNPTTVGLGVGHTIQVTFGSQDLGMPQYTLWADNARVAVFQYQGGVTVYNESTKVRFVSSTGNTAILEPYSLGTTSLKVTANGEIRVCNAFTFVTVASNPVSVSILDVPPPQQQPYGGTAWAVPGTVQAENYDTGGENVAYHDTTTGNSGNTYRTDGVDIQATTDTGGGNNVGWIAAGEWLEYTINVATSGTYDLAARVASPTGGGSIHVEIDGTNVTGAMTIPSTGGWQTWGTVTRSGIQLAPGRYVMRVAIDAAGFNLNWVSLTVATASAQQPYGGRPWGVPGTIEVENYDTGGEGVAYHDTTSGNSGGAYRSDSVDIQAVTDYGGGYNVGWIEAGEWLEYTITVGTGGTYTLLARVASLSTGGTLHAEVDGVNVTGALSFPSTTGWQIWQTSVSNAFSLSTGPHVLRVVADTGSFNLNWVRLQSGTIIPPPTTPAPAWQLVWSDEFDGPSVNTSNWSFQTGCNWSGGSDLMDYTDGANTSFQNDPRAGSSVLVLEARMKSPSLGACGITSTRMYTQGKRSFLYGKVEARLAVPMGQGTWPSLWMLGDTGTWPSNGEIDIMEHINNTSSNVGALHWDDAGHQMDSASVTVPDMTDYHVYGIEWDASQIRFYVDGEVYKTVDISTIPQPAFHQASYLILDLAIGGSWPGYPTSTDIFPVRYYIDYVRVYQR